VPLLSIAQTVAAEETAIPSSDRDTCAAVVSAPTRRHEDLFDKLSAGVRLAPTPSRLDPSTDAEAVKSTSTLRNGAPASPPRGVVQGVLAALRFG
jgi:hypothetical protein